MLHPKPPFLRYCATIILIAIVAISINAQDSTTQLTEVESLSKKVGELYKAGKFDEAIPIAEKALEIAQTFGSEHRLVGDCLVNLGMIYLAKGDLVRAKSYGNRGLEINEASDNRVSLAMALNWLGMICEAEGNFELAEQHLLRAHSLLEDHPELEYPYLATVVGNLGMVYKEAGEYFKAEPANLRAIAMIERATNPSHPDLCPLLANTGLLYKEMGDYKRAGEFLLRAVDINKQTWGDRNPNFAILVADVGAVFEQAGDFENAEKMYSRALKIAVETMGPTHLNVASFLNNLVNVRMALGKYDLAHSLLVRSLIIREQVLGKEHPDLAYPLTSLGNLYLHDRDYARAEMNYGRALALTENAFGNRNAHFSSILLNLVTTNWKKGDHTQALTTLEQSIRVDEQIMSIMLNTGSQEQKQLFLNTLSNKANLAVAFHAGVLPNNAAAARLSLLSIFIHKGRVLDAMSDQISILRRRAEPKSQPLFSRWRSILAQLGSIEVLNAGKLSPDARRAEVARLEAEREKLESDMSRMSLDLSSVKEPITLEAVGKAIPPGSALIEFRVYSPVNIEATKMQEMLGASRYAGYVLLPNETVPRWVDLGDAASIDSLVEKFRSALRNPRRNDVAQLARAVDKRIMTPVRNILGPTKRILVSPDGDLNLVPFAALVDENGHYLVENYSINYLTSGRDLLRARNTGENREPLIIFADPLYDLTTSVRHSSSTSQPDLAESKKSSQARSRTLSEHYDSLPGTADEANALRQLVPNAVVRTQRDATERALKNVNRPRMLHIATHGFFLNDQPQPVLTGRIRGFGLALAKNKIEPAATDDENPLLQSGLILAGIKQRSSGLDEDGLLSALEVAGLDLWGTKLVVLSACDTGLGDVKDGEGVYGLRRALMLAGSETQVMSLWKVSDGATRDLMIAYYTRLQNGEGRAEALRQVQLEMLRAEGTSSKSKGRQTTAKKTASMKGYGHPYFWASFISSGNWRNLDEQDR